MVREPVQADPADPHKSLLALAPVLRVTDAEASARWYAQTLRHLVHATDRWLGGPVLRREDPFHPLGLTHEAGDAEFDARTSAAHAPEPTVEEVLAARTDRQTMVRDHLARVDAEHLRESRPNPHDPQYEETVLSCVRTILDEEWEHHRYAMRDLDAWAATQASAHGGSD